MSPNSGRYRYYTCSIKARQGKEGCSGQTMPMGKLDDLVTDHIEKRLLQPERVEVILANLLDRRAEKAARRRAHIAELNRKASEAEARLKRLYDAIEAGIADLNDPALKDRITTLKALRDQAQADAARATALHSSTHSGKLTPQMVQSFTDTARRKLHQKNGYRRDHIRALAQRIEVHDTEIRIIGNKTDLLHTLANQSEHNTSSVPSSVLKWRRRSPSRALGVNYLL